MARQTPFGLRANEKVKAAGRRGGLSFEMSPIRATNLERQWLHVLHDEAVKAG